MLALVELRPLSGRAATDTDFSEALTVPFQSSEISLFDKVGDFEVVYAVDQNGSKFHVMTVGDGSRLVDTHTVSLVVQNRDCKERTAARASNEEEHGAATLASGLDAALFASGDIGALLAGPADSGKARAVRRCAARAWTGASALVVARASELSDPSRCEHFLAQADAALASPLPAVILLTHAEDLNEAPCSDYVARKLRASLLERSRLRGSYSGALLVMTTDHETIEKVPASLRRLCSLTMLTGLPDMAARKSLVRRLLHCHVIDEFHVDVIAARAAGLGYAGTQRLVREALRAAPGDGDSIMKAAVALTQSTVTKTLVAPLRLLARANKVSAASEAVHAVEWEEVAGMSIAKRALYETVVLPGKNPSAFKRFNIKPANGILLFGPPGTGKTMLAKAAASASQGGFIAGSIPSLVNSYIGESEKALRALFHAARKRAPCVLFLDEIDAVFGGEESQGMSGELFALLDDVASWAEAGTRVCVLGATNCPEKLDAGLFAAHRFAYSIHVPLPDMAARVEQLKHLFLKTHTQVDNVEVAARKLADIAQGRSGADLASVATHALERALARGPAERPVEADWLSALAGSTPSVRQADALRLAAWSPFSQSCRVQTIA